jgi:hypothetical protein
LLVLCVYNYPEIHKVNAILSADGIAEKEDSYLSYLDKPTGSNQIFSSNSSVKLIARVEPFKPGDKMLSDTVYGQLVFRNANSADEKFAFKGCLINSFDLQRSKDTAYYKIQLVDSSRKSVEKLIRKCPVACLIYIHGKNGSVARKLINHIRGTLTQRYRSS